ncbi:MAG: hypothetical protein NXY59_01695 [Aigarchaeota archaeon]|nr:hypothetical protein [Candidatus Pelearchaeum maunauluense]
MFKRWGRYLCRGCGGSFNDKTGTLLHYSRLSLVEFVLLFVNTSITAYPSR